jgi:hypothetical protein
MKRCDFSTRKERGYALMLVLIFTGIGLLVMGGVLSWSTNNANHIERHNQYYTTLAAAEAATEKILSDICTTYQKEGEGSVYAKMSTYNGWVPTSAESSYWSDFEFNDGSSHVGKSTVTRISEPAFTNLNGQFTGLYGMAASYRVISNARKLNAPFDIQIGLMQEAQVSTIPVFQFAIFYSQDLEINPGPNMKITGRVHGNADIYTSPGNTLRFMSDVTSVGNVYRKRKDSSASTGTVTYDKSDSPKSGYNSLSLPIGTNNTSDAVYAILQVPPSSENPNSAMGKQRYYNSADIIVLVSNASVTITSGLTNNFATTLVGDTNWISTNSNYAGSILKTNLTFTDQREGKTIKTTSINVSNLVRWSATNTSIRGLINRDVSSVYVADFRTTNSSYGAGILVTNGQTLPSLGLTVATPNPLYVQGNYNAPAAYLGTTNTTLSKPASLVCDAINVLSTVWNPAKSASSISSRTAADTTVNAAIISGIVPTVGSSYSGGVENFPRFLENWDTKNLTYNGSMVVMFNSHVATANWSSTGTVYNPPVRNWAFDLNYMDPTKLPPGTPSVRALVRYTWTTIPKNTTF